MTAAAVAGVLSGVPSTIHAVTTGRPLLEGARAAGELLGRPSVGRGLAAHAVVSVWWAAIMSRLVPTRRQIMWSVLIGYLIARLDLDVVAPRRYPAITALHRRSQIADHIAFGVLVGAVLAHRDCRIQ